MRPLLNRPLLMYTLIGLVIMGPMLLPGYIFALDMVFGPHIRLPNEITASYPFYLVLKLLSFVMPTWVIQKCILLSIIVLSGLGAHTLTRYLVGDKDTGQVGAYFAGLLYIINPFTYTRFMDGHFAVLLGYAILPFFVHALFEIIFDKKYTLRQSAKIALYALISVIFSIHAIGYITVVSVVAIGIFIFHSRSEPEKLIPTAKYLGLAAVLFVVLNSYWLIPMAMGNTPREALIQNFDMRHFLSFRTDGATDLGVLGNIITMHGYWGDREGRYTLPQAVNPFWPVFFIPMLLLAGYGFYHTRRSPATLTLAVSGCVATVLAVGIAAAPFNHVNTWLIDSLPFFRGFREPQKFVSVLAMFYAILGGVGVAYFRTSTFLSKRKSDHLAWVVGLVLILPILCTPTFLGGFAGQLRSRTYPTDWGQANTEYVSKSSGATLFLPWHQYMYFDFAGRVITHPAPVYFDGNVIASDNVEIGLIHRQTSDPNSDVIEQALSAKDSAAFSQMLTKLHIEYVVLSKNADWQAYSYLDHMQLDRVRDSETLKIYRNPAFGQQF